MRTESGSSRKTERVLTGLGVSPGVAIGPVYVSDDGEVPVEAVVAEEAG